jgi:hypothetical protein
LRSSTATRSRSLRNLNRNAASRLIRSLINNLLLCSSSIKSNNRNIIRREGSYLMIRIQMAVRRMILRIVIIKISHSKYWRRIKLTINLGCFQGLMLTLRMRRTANLQLLKSSFIKRTLQRSRHLRSLESPLQYNQTPLHS